MSALVLAPHTTPRQNAKTWGNRFTSRWLEPGIVSYEDGGGDKELLKKETIDAHMQSFIGRPVIIKHRKVTPQTMENVAEGYITRVWFEPADGWFYCEGIITGDEAKQLIQHGWSVSCSYHVTGTDERPGSYHAIPYAREITAFDGEHLAIVENPRYEGATIRLNSKQPKENTVNLFKLFKKVAAPSSSEPKPADKKDEGTPPASHENSIKADAQIEVAPGKTATVAELVARYNAAPAETEDLSPESTIEVAPGKIVTLGELVSRFNDSLKPYGHKCEAHPKVKRNADESDEDYMNRCHAFDEEEKRRNEEETKKKHENDEEAKKKHENAGPKPSDFFRVLSAVPTATPVQIIDRANSAETEADKIARGRDRYGSVRHGKN